MKNFKIIYIIFLMMILISCSKDTCEFVGDCTPIEPEGFMVTTMSSSNYSTVGTIYKTTNNATAPIGNNWNDPSFGVNQVQSIHPAMWTTSNIGQVFGLALDDNYGIYMSATTVYQLDYAYASTPIVHGTGGYAGIYYTNIATPTSTNITTTLVKTGSTLTPNTVGSAIIPNSGIGIGNGIGNIAYDKKNKQLFATNLEDGRIYRIDPVSGNVLSIFDPFALDNAINGIAPQGEQLWGIAILNEGGKVSVYFDRTLTTTATAPGSFSGSPGTKQIWAIDLDANGEFAATEVGSTKLFTDSSNSKLQIANVPGTEAKITDIAFSCSGKMLLAERGGPHTSYIFEYVKVGSIWVTGNNFYIGNYSAGNNSAGGVDYGSREVAGKFISDDIVWGTGNALNVTVNWMYGVQGMSSSGNSSVFSANSSSDLFIDYNNIYNVYDKGSHGDVEIFDSNCPCNNTKLPTYTNATGGN